MDLAGSMPRPQFIRVLKKRKQMENPNPFVRQGADALSR